MFTGWPLAVNMVLFAAGAAGVWQAGTAIARYADEIAERYKLGRAIVGLVFLASVTELPEIATTFTAAIAGEAKLVLGNMFGGITLQTSLLAIVDAVAVRGVLTMYPRKPTHALEAALLITLLGFLLLVCIAGDRAFWRNVGYGTVLLAGLYFICIWLLRSYDVEGDWVPVDLPDEPAPDAPVAGRHAIAALFPNQLWARSGLAAFIILVCGMVLVFSSEAIAEQTGLGTSFIGITLLAAATSLPELSTTFAAARLGAYTLAISNIFGSNLIMLVLLLPADLLYRPGPILQVATTPEMLALAAGVLVTAIYVAGMIMRRKRQVFGMGMDSLLVLMVYAGSLVMLYQLR